MTFAFTKKPTLFAVLSTSALLLVACGAQEPNVDDTTDLDDTGVLEEQVDTDSSSSIMAGTDGSASSALVADMTTEFTLAEVAQHSTQESCYTAVDGKVYDVTSFIPNHPGGVQRIMQVCGKDGTELFMGKHSESENALARLEGLQIGVVVE